MQAIQDGSIIEVVRMTVRCFLARRLTRRHDLERTVTRFAEGLRPYVYALVVEGALGRGPDVKGIDRWIGALVEESARADLGLDDRESAAVAWIVTAAISGGLGVIRSMA